MLLPCSPCCTPSGPCSCPDFCRYGWEWGGSTLVPVAAVNMSCVNVGGTNTCKNAGEAKNFLPTPALPYGLLTNIVASTAKVETALFDYYRPGAWYPTSAIAFTYYERIFGDAAGKERYLVDAGLALREMTNPAISYETRLTVAAVPNCPRTATDTSPQTWLLRATRFQTVEMGSRDSWSDEKTDRVVLYKRAYSCELTLPAACVANGNYWCCPPTNATLALHLAGDAAITIDGAGVSVGGSSSSWLLDTSAINVDRGLTEWHIPDEYPFQKTVNVTLKARDDCNPLP